MVSSGKGLTTRAVDILDRLVAIPSVSGDEAAISEYIAELLRATGMDVEMQPVGHRFNIIAKTLSTGDLPLLLTGHTDTVPPVSGWESPFRMRRDGDRLIGLGVADQKAGVAAQITVIEELARRNILHQTDLLVAFTCDEEAMSDGTRAFLERKPRARAALLSEPFYTPVILGSPGKAHLLVTVLGEPSHGGTPEQGLNAILAAADLMKALADLTVPEYPGFVSQPYIPMTIRAGYERYSLTVPDQCQFTISKQLVPGENYHTAMAGLAEAAATSGARIDLKLIPPYYEPSKLDLNEPAVKWFTDLFRKVAGREPVFGYGRHVCDQDLFIEAGIPTIAFGPAGGRFHQADEWVSVEAIEVCANLYLEACLACVKA